VPPEARDACSRASSSCTGMRERRYRGVARKQPGPEGLFGGDGLFETLMLNVGVSDWVCCWSVVLSQPCLEQRSCSRPCVLSQLAAKVRPIALVARPFLEYGSRVNRRLCRWRRCERVVSSEYDRAWPPRRSCLRQRAGGYGYGALVGVGWLQIWSEENDG
jgi:hypothetical protein